MKIAVIGTGYVGLVTAAGLAEFGHTVIGTDKDAAKIELISRGTSPIYEPGLEDLLKRTLASGNLSFSADVDATIREAGVIFVCVGTPQDEDGRADMSQIEGVARSIARNLNGYKVVVEKSTVPVKTSEWIKRVIGLYRKGDTPFDVASNPEFLREGSAVPDFLEPDRIIVGVETRPGPGHAGPDLREVPGPRPRHQHRHGRAHQARLELVPRPQDLLHQHDRRPLRAGRTRTWSRSPWAWASIRGSGGSSSKRAWATAAPVSPRTSGPS